MPLTFEDKYNILLNKDSTYEGVFIVAVKTTKIFCKPVCPARKPKPENVVFYDTVQEALDNGFRACKKCRPLEKVNELPLPFKNLLDRLHRSPEMRLKDIDLHAMQIDSVQLRRWFKKHYQTTFHAYQRNLRMNSAFQKIAAGEAVSATAFDSGFESLSGFTERFRSTFGQAPVKSKDTMVINLKQLLTPLGPMYAGASAEGVCFVEFIDRVKLEDELTALCKELNAVILPGEHEHLVQLEKELTEYFDKKRTVFTVPLHLTGSDFQKSVWQALLEIPYGKTWSYKQQAIRLDKLTALRAVAAANGQNKHAIIIPCHRVIGSNGSLTGYAAGIGRKEWLLKFENGAAAQSPELPFE